MDNNEKDAVLDLLKTVRIGLVIMAVVGGYANREMLVGLI
jgi:hypothetical protein